MKCCLSTKKCSQFIVMNEFCKILVTSLIFSQMNFFMLKTIQGRNFVSRHDTAHQEELCLCRIINLLANPLAQEVYILLAIPRRYGAEILPILRRNTIQSINQSCYSSPMIHVLSRRL